MKIKSISFHWDTQKYLVFLFVFIFFGLGAVLTHNKKPAEAAWFNDSWLYRRVVSVTNTTGANVTDYQVSLSLDTATLISGVKMRADCGDVRITDFDGKVLPYWIEDGGSGACNSATTRIWVKVPTLPTSGANVYVYYGNSVATTIQDPYSVFTFFDAFSSSAVDSNKWNTSGSPAQSSGIVSLSSSATLVSKTALTDSSGLGRVIFRAKQAATNLTGGKIGFSNTSATATHYNADDAANLVAGSTEEQVNSTASTNLVSHHQLEETTSTDANQFKASGYFDTGKLNQAVSIYGNAAGTAGSILTVPLGNQISGNNYEHWNPNQGTISFWVKPSWNGNDGLDHYFFSRYYYGYDIQIFKTASGGRLYAYFTYTEGTTRVVNADVSSWTAGNWYHVVVRWDSKNIVSGSNYAEIYVNNVYLAGYTSGWTARQPGYTGTIGALSVVGAGGATSTSQAQALIDDFAIYDRVLTTTEITSLYNSGTGNEAGYVADPSLKFYAKLDGSGTLSPVTYNAGASASKMTAKSTELTGGVNKLANSRFQSATGGVPTSWTSQGSPTLADAEAANILFDTRAQKITATPQIYGAGFYQTVSVSENENYHINVWIKSDGANRATIGIYDVTHSDWVPGYSVGAANLGTTSSSWTQIQYDFKVPAGCAQIYVAIRSAWNVDHIFYIQEVTMTPNSVDNGGMEGTYVDGVAPGWTLFNGATLTDETTTVHSGGHSQKVVASIASSGISTSSSTFATAGNQYLVSFWLYGVSGSVSISDSGGGNMLVVTPPATWTKYSQIVTWRTTIGLTIASRNAAATFYLDDVSVIPLDNVATSFKSWTPVKDTSTTSSLETHTSANAASDPNGNESNATTGWTATSATLASVATGTPNTGSYHMHLTSDVAGGCAKYPLTLTIGNTYKVTFNSKVVSADSQALIGTSTANCGWDDNRIELGSDSSTSYVARSYEFKATYTSAALYIRVQGQPADSYFDNLSIKESADPLSVQGSLTGVASNATGARGNAYTFDGTTGFLRQKTYDVNVGTLTYQDTNTDISDDGQEFEDWDNDNAGSAEYMIVVTNSDNTTSWGYFCADDGGVQTAVYTLKACTGGSQGFNGTSPSGKTPVGYEVRKTDYQITGNTITLGAWINYTSPGVIISKRDTAGSGGYNLDNLGAGGGGKIRISIGDGSTLTSNAAVSVSTWHYIVATFSSGTASIYIDGALDNTEAGYNNTIDNSTALQIGSKQTSGYPVYFITGSIDSPFVISSALTADQIKDIYNSTASHYGITTNNATTNTSPANSGLPTVDANTYHSFQLSVSSSQSVLNQDGTTIATSTTNLPNSSSYLRIQNADTTNALTLDWVAVAKGASADPTPVVAAESVGTGAVGYWKFDDPSASSGQVALDSSSQGNNGTLGSTGGVDANDPIWQSEDMCVAGKCLKFDGSDDYVDAADNLEMGTKDWTVEAWIRTSQATAGRIVSKDNNGNNATWEIGINMAADNKFSARLINTGGTSVFATSSTSVNDNKWHHVVGVWSRSGNLQTYIDGKADGSPADISASLGQDISNAINLSIGKRIAGGFYNGFIDDVKIYPYARTATQIKADYYAGKSGAGSTDGTTANLTDNQPLPSSLPAGLSNGLVGYWKMDEVSGNTLDSSGNGNTGTANGTTVTTGKFGNGRQFNGTSDYISMGTSDNLNLSSAITGSLWFKTPSSATSGYKWLIDKINYPNDGWEFVQIASLMNYQAAFWHNGVPSGSCSTGTISASTWYNFTFTYSGGQLNCYLNGSLLSSSAATLYSSSGSYFALGARYSDPTFVGFYNSLLDEVRIYNRALSAEEVKALYEWSPNSNAYFKMDENTGSTINDTSTNGNATTSSGNPLNYTVMPTWVNGRFGSGTNFDGIDDYYYSADSATTDQSGSMTVSSQVKPSKVGSNFASGTIASKGSNYTLGISSNSSNSGNSSNLTNAFFTTNNITTQLSGTSINDIYFYDTTKDTDYGTGKSTDPLVWRFDSTKSWYTETIDATYRNCVPATHDRCGNKEFPEKAYIVISGYTLYIFDATENAMWMRFDLGANNIFYGTADEANSATAVFALNGKIYTATNRPSAGGGSGLRTINFTNDSAFHYGSGGYAGTYQGNISQRNTTLGWSNTGTIDIINNFTNDVHAAVVSGRTYVAVATDGGVSVVNETDGTVVNFYHNGAATDYAGKVFLASDGTLYFSYDIYNSTIAGYLFAFYTSNPKWSTGSTAPYADANKYYAPITTPATTGWTIKDLYVTSNTSTVDGTSNTIFLSTISGINVIQEKQGDESNGSVKYVTKDYITEEIIGDIRGMWPFNGSGAIANATDISDASVKATTMTSSNANGTGMTYAAGVRGTGITFDGTDDYLKQKVYYDQTGATFGPTVHGLNLSTTAAFYRAQGRDLSTYHGTDGSTTPYMLVLRDATNKTAWGYIGSTDAAQALGSELITGDTSTFTSGVGTWTRISGNGTFVASGGKGVLTNTDGVYGYWNSGVGVTAGKLYLLSVKLKSVSGDAIVRFGDTINAARISFTATGTEATYTGYFTAGASGTAFTMKNANIQQVEVDDISLKEVTDVGVDGVHIVSTKNGATRTWAGIESGFNYNDSAYTFEVRKTDFQITGNLTVGAWVKLDTLNTRDSIIAKWGANANSNQSLMLFCNVWGVGYCNLLATSTGNNVYTNRTASAPLAAETWYHIIGVYSPSNNLDIYINGTLSNGTISGSIPASLKDTPTSFTVGADLDSDTSDTPLGFFDGTIDEPFVTAEALTASQIKRMYEVGLRAKNAAGTSALNGSSNQVNAVVANGLSVYTDASSVRKVTTQKLYAGTEGGGVSEIDLNSDTLVNYYTTGTTPAINHNNVNALTVSPGGSFLAGLDSGVSRLDDVSNRSNTANSTSFTHVAGTYDKTAGYYYLYENGQEVGKTYIGTSHNPATNSANLVIGGYAYNSGYGYPFYGVMDDAIVYSYARTAGQISSDSQGVHGESVILEAPRGNTTIGGGSATGSPVLYMKFDEGSGSVAHSQTWAPAGTTTNLVTNPSFETNLTSWAKTQGTETHTQSSEKSVFGGYSLKVVTPGGSVSEGANYPGTATVAGNTYTASAWIWAPVGATINLYLRDDHVPGGTNTGITGNGAWQKATAVRTMAAGATTMSIWIQTITSAQAITFYIDGVQLEQTTTATSYCDGSLTGYGTHTWSGTAHASTSTCTYGGQDGEINGATWTNSGKFGKALSFPGGNNYVDAGNDASLNLTNAITVEAWVKTSDTSVFQNIIMKTDTSTNGFQLYFRPSSPWMYWKIADSSGTFHTCSVTTQYQDGGWHHVVGTFNGSNIIAYVDGVQSCLTAWTGTINLSSQHLLIGNALVGLVDEVKIFNFALTAEQVKQEYNHAAMRLGAVSTESDGTTPSDSRARAYCVPGDTATCTAPVAEWNFDEKTGTTVADQSGNNNTGTISGATWTLGKFGSALMFDGNDDAVNVGKNTVLNDLDIKTVEAWIYPKSAGGGSAARIVDKGNWSVRLNTVNYLFFVQVFSGSGGGWSSTNPVFVANNWYHVTVVYDRRSSSNVPIFYVNGIPIAVSTITPASGSANNDVGSDLTIGNNAFSGGIRAWDGSIDQVRIYNYARTPAQIAWDYNYGAPVGWWKLDECQGTTVRDASGNGNVGTITIGGNGTQTSAGTCQDSATTAWYSGRSGKFNSSLNFDGSDDYVGVADNDPLDLSTGSFSFFSWIKAAMPAGSTDSIVNKGASGPTSKGYWLAIQTGTNKLRLDISDGSSYIINGDTVMSNSVVADGSWHHVGFIWNPQSGVTFYVDGKTNGTFAATTSVDISNTATMKIGGYTSSGFTVDGQIDDVRIYNYALTAAQVKAVYNGGAVRFGPQSGPPN